MHACMQEATAAGMALELRLTIEGVLPAPPLPAPRAAGSAGGHGHGHAAPLHAYAYTALRAQPFELPRDDTAQLRQSHIDGARTCGLTALMGCACKYAAAGIMRTGFEAWREQ